MLWVKQPVVGSGCEWKGFMGGLGGVLAASFALVVCQSLLSACPHLCLSLLLQGQATSVPRQQQVSMEQQAGQQMVQGWQGRVTSVSIKLSPAAPGATGSVCSRLCLLPSVPGASPGSPCVPMPGSMVGTGASPAGWDELLRDATSAAGEGKLLCVVREGSGS